METYKLIGKVSSGEWLAKYTTEFGTIYYIVHDTIKALSSIDNTPIACLLRESQILAEENGSDLVEPILSQISESEM